VLVEKPRAVELKYRESKKEVLKSNHAVASLPFSSCLRLYNGCGTAFVVTVATTVSTQYFRVAVVATQLTSVGQQAR
jgi:hypothetical protein